MKFIMFLVLIFSFFNSSVCQNAGDFSMKQNENKTYTIKTTRLPTYRLKKFDDVEYVYSICNVTNNDKYFNIKTSDNKITLDIPYCNFFIVRGFIGELNDKTYYGYTSPKINKHNFNIKIKKVGNDKFTHIIKGKFEQVSMEVIDEHTSKTYQVTNEVRLFGFNYPLRKIYKHEKKTFHIHHISNEVKTYKVIYYVDYGDCVEKIIKIIYL